MTPGADAAEAASALPVRLAETSVVIEPGAAGHQIERGGDDPEQGGVFSEGVEGAAHTRHLRGERRPQRGCLHATADGARALAALDIAAPHPTQLVLDLLHEQAVYDGGQQRMVLARDVALLSAVHGLFEQQQIQDGLEVLLRVAFFDGRGRRDLGGIPARQQPAAVLLPLLTLGLVRALLFGQALLLRLGALVEQQG